MKELLLAIVEGLVENKQEITITEDAPNEEGVIEFKGDSSLTRDENGCWSNYVAVN